MSIDIARHLLAELRAFIDTDPDYPAPPGIDVDGKFEEVDRMINVLREVTAKQTVILGQLIEAWPPPTT